MADEIPDVFLQALQGVHALEQEVLEDGYDDVWRMGEYLDPGPDDFLGGSDGLGRHVALYWGSFRAIAEADPEFDWDEEIWETLTHELQHHVESLAGDGRLIEEDLLEARAWAEGEEAEDVGREADGAREAHREPGEAARGGWLSRLFGKRS
jgi:hypothetical protein